MAAPVMHRDLLDRARMLQDRIVGWRRHIHAHPELGMEEFETSKLVRQVLEELGIEVRWGPEATGTPTGVVGILRGTAPGQGPARCVGIRADMDCLPIQERTGLPFASRHPGKMHACGHDAHTAILLGTAALLAAMRSSFRGTVKFFFQPAEEGPGGGEPMVKAGVMENPKVDMVLALHVGTIQDTGTISLKPGPSTAAADTAVITIKGKGAHGAWPHNGVDAIVAAGHAIVALQTLVSRETAPLESVVFTIGTIHGGYANNVIADEVKMEATVRTLKKEIREAMPGRIERVLKGVTEALGASYELEYVWGYPTMVNDPRVCRLVEQRAAAMLGRENVLIRDEPGMGAEDFAYFTEAAPGCMFGLGAGSAAKGIKAPGHSPFFTVDEDALPVGVALFADVALAFLKDGLPD